MKKQKILLINPTFEYKKKRAWRNPRLWPPIDLAIMASILRNNNFKVEILDNNVEGLSNDEISNKCKNFDKVLVTSSSLDRWQCPHLNINPFLGLVKKILENNKKTIIMGTHVGMRPETILNELTVYAAIIGEPEETVLEICKNKDISKIKGIAYRRKGKIVFNKPRDLTDLKDLPPPALELLPMDKYYYELMGENFSLLEASRGCPYQCIFCAKKIMYGNKYRKKPLENIKKEIQLSVEKFGVKNLYFFDLEFTIDKNFVEKICNFLIEKNYDLEWTCQTRADSLNPELLEKMKRSGCKLIHFGVETGSPRIMKIIKKNTSLEKIKAGIEMTRKAGIESACFMMMGFPTETEEDMKMTIEFAKQLNPDYVSFHIATPYPGTEFYKMAEGSLKELFPTFYSVEHSEDFLKKMTNKGFIQFYLRPSYILPRIFKNPKLLFKQFKLFLRFIG